MVRRRFLQLLSRTVNPLALRLAHTGRGPFAELSHVGRRTGTTYRTPLILARVDDGFVAELTYGDQVSWYRNLRANGRGEVLVGGVRYEVAGIDDYPSAAGLAAYPLPARTILKILRRRQFRLIRVERERP